MNFDHLNKSPSEIASGIADDFYPIASLQHADLRRRIERAIEAERAATEHYINQMGRWWDDAHRGEVDTSRPVEYRGPARIGG